MLATISQSRRILSSESGHANLLDDFSVDTMLLDGHTIICLRVVDRRHLDFWENTKFDSTGHYPILAGYDPNGEPLYVAAVRLDLLWHFTTVKEGACTAIYNDDADELNFATEFFVLALRHDPSDFSPPYPRVRKGAMDPTGPVSWLRSGRRRTRVFQRCSSGQS